VQEHNYVTGTGLAPPGLGTFACGPVFGGNHATWDTLAVKNVAVSWQFDVRWSNAYGAHADYTSDWVPVLVENTVVSSDGHLLIWDGHTPPANITWTVGHRPVSGLTFDVDVDITNVVTGVVVRHYDAAQTKLGSKQISWDGKKNDGQDADRGVYTYKVAAGHAWYTGVCHDQDRSFSLSATLNDGKFYWISKDTQAGR